MVCTAYIRISVHCTTEYRQRQEKSHNLFTPFLQNKLYRRVLPFRKYLHDLYKETLIKSSSAADGSFAPTFAYKNLEIHTVFLRFLTQNLRQNLSPSALAY